MGAPSGMIKKTLLSSGEGRIESIRDPSLAPSETEEPYRNLLRRSFMIVMSVSEWLAVVQVVSLTQCLAKVIRTRPRLSDNYILFTNPHLQDAIRGIPKTIRLTLTAILLNSHQTMRQHCPLFSGDPTRRTRLSEWRLRGPRRSTEQFMVCCAMLDQAARPLYGVRKVADSLRHMSACFKPMEQCPRNRMGNLRDSQRHSKVRPFPTSLLLIFRPHTALFQTWSNQALSNHIPTL